jgi:hypothetical protein
MSPPRTEGPRVNIHLRFTTRTDHFTAIRAEYPEVAQEAGIAGTRDCASL